MLLNEEQISSAIHFPFYTSTFISSYRNTNTHKQKIYLVLSFLLIKEIVFHLN